MKKREEIIHVPPLFGGTFFKCAPQEKSPIPPNSTQTKNLNSLLLNFLLPKSTQPNKPLGPLTIKGNYELGYSQTQEQKRKNCFRQG